MKIRTYNILAALIIAGLSSCSDDEEKKATSTFKLSQYLEAADFVITDTLVHSSNWQYEFGLKFTPTVAGSIEKVLVRLPEDREDVRVTIWDAEAGTVLRMLTVSVEEHVLVTQAIDPLLLEVGHEYMITFNSSTWYEYKRADEEPVTYPFTAGLITILGYGYNEGDGQVMPADFPTDYYAGDLTFTFKVSE